MNLTDLAAAVDQAAEGLVAVLDAAATAAAMSISPTQLRVLTILRSSPDVNVNRLAEALQVVPSSASRLCDRLEALGLLYRTADNKDRREVQLRMTSAARAKLDQLSKRRHEALTEVLARMPEARRRELLRSLTAFAAAALDQPAADEGRRSA
jgi:DNA-binding MarR family transcriptional regulator